MPPPPSSSVAFLCLEIGLFLWFPPTLSQLIPFSGDPVLLTSVMSLPHVFVLVGFTSFISYVYLSKELTLLSLIFLMCFPVLCFIDFFFVLFFLIFLLLFALHPSPAKPPVTFFLILHIIWIVYLRPLIC